MDPQDIHKAPNMLTRKAAARLLGVSPYAVNEGIKDGKIETVRLGKTTFVVKTSLVALISGDTASEVRTDVRIPGEIKLGRRA